MKVNIWGSRGSIARSHKDLMKYGGNTSCVEVETESTRIILDMGSGAYDCGQKLVKMGKLTDQHILLSHTHWDHIQGFPFFAPFFIKGSEWNVHAPGGFSATVRDKLSTQMSHDFFPLSIDNLEAHINYHDLIEGDLKIGEVQVQTQYMNHNVLTLGYRLQAPGGASVAYCTDHEPYDRTLGKKGYTRTPGDTPKTPDDKHADFFAGVDLLIHDTQYVASEYHKTEGYGHSSVEYVVDMAMAVGVKKLALFHHDPQRTDAQVDAIVQLARDRVQAADGTLEVIAAADNLSLTVKSRGEHSQTASESNISDILSSTTRARRSHPSGLLSKAIRPVTLRQTNRAKSEPITRGSAFAQGPSSTQAVVISHPEKESFEGLELDGVQTVHMENNSAFIDKVLKRQPSLILVRHDGDDSTIETCKRLRRDGGEWGHQVPYLLTVPDQATLDAIRKKGDHAGVTDFIVEPFKQSYIRTRIRMGITRVPCRWVPPVTPTNEMDRLQALQSLRVLDTEPEERFDRITGLCSKIFDVPVVLVSLVDTNRQWFKSSAWHCPVPGGGTTPPRETGRDISFCGHAILSDELLIVRDATQDQRFADNPLVAEQDGLKIRFYCGCPLRIPVVDERRCVKNGTYRVGTLCLIDQRPRDIDDAQQAMLRDFAAMVQDELVKVKQIEQRVSQISGVLSAKQKNAIDMARKEKGLPALSA